MQGLHDIFTALLSPVTAEAAFLAGECSPGGVSTHRGSTTVSQRNVAVSQPSPFFSLFFAAETKSRDVSRSKDVPNAGHDEAKAMAHSKRYIF